MSEQHVMLDLETLGVSPDSTILQISAIIFDPFNESTQYEDVFNELVDIDSQNRSIDANTVAWWGTQPKEIQEIIFSEENRLPLDITLKKFTKFVWNKNRIWSQGPDFDISILKHAFFQYNLPLPWPYWKVRDSRTILDLTSIDLPAADHNAISDCRRQAAGVCRVIKQLGITRFIR